MHTKKSVPADDTIKLWRHFGFDPILASSVVNRLEYQDILAQVSAKVNEKRALKAFPTEFRDRVKAGTVSRADIDSTVKYVQMEISDFVYFKPDVFIGAPSQRKYVAVARDNGIKQTAAFIPDAFDLENRASSFYRSTNDMIVLNKDTPAEIEEKLARANPQSLEKLQDRLAMDKSKLAEYFSKLRDLFN